MVNAQPPSGHTNGMVALGTRTYRRWGCAQPTSLRNAGTTVRWKHTNADTGLPGNPNT